MKYAFEMATQKAEGYQQDTPGFPQNEDRPLPRGRRNNILPRHKTPDAIAVLYRMKQYRMGHANLQKSTASRLQTLRQAAAGQCASCGSTGFHFGGQRCVSGCLPHMKKNCRGLMIRNKNTARQELCALVNWECESNATELRHAAKQFRRKAHGAC